MRIAPLCLLALPLFAQDPAAAQQAARRALAAYRAKHYKTFLKECRAAADADETPAALHNLACAEALNHHPDQAFEALRRQLVLKVDTGALQDADLASLRGAPQWAGLVKDFEALKAPVGSAEVAFKLPEKDLLTEGLAWDSGSGDFFVSSVHHRKILRRHADGRVEDFVPEGRDGLWGVLALAVDETRGRVWAASAALEEMSGWDKSMAGSTGLFCFDLKDGHLIRKVLVKDGKAAALGDLLLGPGGEVYASDGAKGGIYRLKEGAEELETVLAPGRLPSPQGMVFSRDGKWILVADYVQGLYRMNPDSGRFWPIFPADGLCLRGIDGLVRAGSALIATQNGIAPHRVVRLEMDGRESQVQSSRILLMNHPDFAEPTLLTLAGRSVYVIAASQWGRFAKGEPDPVSLKEPVVLKLGLGAR